MNPRSPFAALALLTLAALFACLAPRAADAQTSTTEAGCRPAGDRGHAGFFRTDPWARGELVLTFQLAREGVKWPAGVRLGSEFG